MNIRQKLGAWKLNPAATEAKIVEVERGLNVALPNDYRAFLLDSNGGGGLIGENEILLDPVDHLVDYNAALNAAEIAPGLVVIGGNGSGELLAFDTRVDPWSVVLVPAVGLDLESAIPIAASFTELLEREGNWLT